MTYTGVDDCNNPLTASASITVTPAPPATLSPPVLPTTLDCEAASAYTTAPDATYTNGLTGACLNDGTIPADRDPKLDPLCRRNHYRDIHRSR